MVELICMIIGYIITYILPKYYIHFYFLFYTSLVTGLGSRSSSIPGAGREKKEEDCSN
ncbi:hypothetical protein KFK09_027806 [Dendrobium nobile]|uniref:Uncharacterized protein n=1 Tax=Dendrobium nobile TaxID=94219 RepID=A0A8T3A5L6_DENNO|nr:hypothetical protein KFK09_027806 [Dendrobium nobile]